MDWVRKNWILLACGLVALAGIGIGVWSRLGFSRLQAEANSIADIVVQLETAKRDPVNEATITEARNYYAKTNKGTVDELEKALAINKRTPLRDDVFPTEKGPDSGYRFRDAYRAAMQKLPEIINGGKAPTAAVVDSIIHRMEDKLRKEAKLTGAGGELRVPKPPSVQPWVAPTPGPRPVPGRPGFEDRPAGGGFEEDPSRRGGGFEEDPSRRRGGGFEEDPSRRRGGVDMLPPTYLRPGLQPTQPQVTIPTPEQLRPAAEQAAVYQAARSIWTYVNDDSFDMHPLGQPGSVSRPTPEELWGAQMFLWIEQDVAQALRKVNEQAVGQLPEDQRWVAYLPVKHLVELRISDYLTAGTTDMTGRQSSTLVLHRTSGGSTGYLSGSNVRFGSAGASFTNRMRTGDYDVVHFALKLVVDARDLPMVLAQLCKQNFFTPIQVQYRNVDVMAARAAGYLYGTGPIINVDIVCEALFFRLNYERWMPPAVKNILEGGVGGGSAGYVR
jgi:hypothetical protein